jgi:hypothetical protein
MSGTAEPIAAPGNSSLPCLFQPLVLRGVSNPSIEQAGLGRRATGWAPGGFWGGSLRIKVGKDLLD